MFFHDLLFHIPNTFGPDHPNLLFQGYYTSILLANRVRLVRQKFKKKLKTLTHLMEIRSIADNIGSMANPTQQICEAKRISFEALNLEVKLKAKTYRHRLDPLDIRH